LSTSTNNSNYHHGDLKTALIEAAELLIKEKGIEELSLRTIAAKVGVSHMAPYSHFKNKSELFQAVAASGFIELGERMQVIKQDLEDPKELILLYGVEYIKFASSNPQLYKLMLKQTHPEQFSDGKSPAIAPNKSQKALLEASKKPYVLLRDGFARFQQDEYKVKIQAQGAWAMVHGIASLVIEGHIVMDENTSIKDFLSIATMGMKS
jgi:AcrR family transcriptional regulator